MVTRVLWRWCTSWLQECRGGSLRTKYWGSGEGGRDGAATAFAVGDV